MAEAKNISWSIRANEALPEGMSGEYTLEVPQTLEEAVSMWGGEAVILSKVTQSVIIDTQGIARRLKDPAKIQETMNKYVPGISTRTAGGGMSNTAMAKALKALEQTDPDQYKSQHVIVVGGGDSALEAAVSLSETVGTTVSLSYRSEAFGRAKKKNRDKVQKAQEEGRLNVLMKSNVKEIRDHDLLLDHDGQKITLRNDAVIICAGGILPTAFLKEIGIEVETKRGTE